MGNRNLAVILVLYLALATAYSLATPVGEGPDEAAHIAYIGFLQTHGRPPRHGEVEGPLALQVKQPPLYYLVGAAAALGSSVDGLAFIDNPHFSVNVAHQLTPAAFGHTAAEQWPYAPVYRAVRRIRLAGMLLGALVIVATFAVARTVAPGRPHLAWAAAGLVAFVPQFVFMQGVVNNDALANPLAALALVFAARVATTGGEGRSATTRRDALLLGVCVGLALLTKLTTAALVGVAGLAVILGAMRTAQEEAARNLRGEAWPEDVKDERVDGAGDARVREAVVDLEQVEETGDARVREAVVDVEQVEETGDARVREAVVDVEQVAAATVERGQAASHSAAGSRHRLRRLLARALLAGLPILASLGWWWLTNWRLTGNLLGTGQAALTASVGLRTKPLWPELPQYFWLQFTSFWGHFGWMSVPLADAVYEGLKAVSLVAAAGLGVAALRLVDRSSRGSAAGWLVVVAAALLTYGVVFSPVISLDLSVAQGRYLFTALPALGLLFAAGLLAWLPARWEALGAAVLVAGELGLAVYGFAGCLWPAFRVPQGVLQTTSEHDADLVERQADDAWFGPAIQLIAHEVRGDVGRLDRAQDAADNSAARRRPARVRAGGKLDIALNWQAASRPTAGYWRFVQVVDARGRVVAGVDGLPDEGRYPTVSWLPGRPFVERLSLQVADEAAPGLGAILVGLYPEGEVEHRVGVESVDRHGAVTTKDALRLDLVIQALEPRLPSRAVRADKVPIGVFMADRPGESSAGVQLVAFESSIGSGGITATMTVTLYWQALAGVSDEDHILVHFLDDDGQMIAGADGPPAEGRFPVSYWLKEDIVADVHQAVLPLADADRIRQVELGWYDPTNGLRLAVYQGTDASRSFLPDNVVRLQIAHSLPVPRR